MIRRPLLGLVAGAVAFAASLTAAWPAIAGFRATAPPTWPASAQPLIVRDILSGDTLIVASNRTGPEVSQLGTITVRLLGIDAPNFATSRECYAEESQAALASLLPVGSVAWIVTDEVTRDEGGRWLGYVWTSEGDFVNVVLASNGIVRAYYTPPNSAYWPDIAQGAEEAWRRSAGLWTDCH